MKKKIAYIFPGQGSQSVGMLSEHLDTFPLIRGLFDKASVILKYDLYDIVYNGPAEKLNKTVYTQPALFIVSFALYQIHVKKFGVSPTFLLGHSLGEYTALACSKALEFEEAVFLVSKRAQLMQEAVPEGKGGMAAIIGLSDEILSDICHEVGGEVSPANYNSIGQIVISGDLAAVEKAMKLAKERGAKIVKQLPVSVPSHSPMMKGAAKVFAEHLNNSSILEPKIPVISNVNFELYNSVSEIKELLIKQLYRPVQWVNSIKYVIENNVKFFVECGPGNILSGLNKRINKEIKTYSGTELSKISEMLEE